VALRDYLHAAADAIADAIEATPGTRLDELIPFTAKALAVHNIEYKPALRLAEEGKLHTVMIGRRRLTTLRHLLAMVDALPSAKAPEPTDDLTAAARKRARRVAA
jgi:hypothetical protein